MARSEGKNERRKTKEQTKTKKKYSMNKINNSADDRRASCTAGQLNQQPAATEEERKEGRKGERVAGAGAV